MENNTTKKRILIVDDEEIIVRMLKLRLESSGYEVIVACDGQDGLKKAKEFLPDLIILDVMMPKMEGTKVCGLLKSDARYKNIPIIMFTAKAQEADRQLSKDLGADEFINKPLEPEDFMNKVRSLLGED